MNSKRNKFAVFLACGILLMVLPFLLQPFGNSWVRIIDMVLLYIMLALGLNIVVGYAGLLDLGYVAFSLLALMFLASWHHHTYSRISLAWQQAFPTVCTTTSGSCWRSRHSLLV